MIPFRLTRAAVLLAAVLFAGGVPAPAVAADWPTSGSDELRLNTSITTNGEDVRLGDVFSGFLSRPEKVVTRAPAPGQRMVLSAKWLANLARTYGLAWQPANQYDRAIVYQPGHTISPEEILSAVKAELIRHGMPENYGVTPQMRLDPITIAAQAPRGIRIREAFFDQATDTFSAVVEIPPGTPDAQFVMLRGIAYPTVTIPVLTQNTGKNTVISADMLETKQVRLTEVWFNNANGIALGTPPLDGAKSKFATFRPTSFQENLDNLDCVCGLIFEQYPDRHIVLTVSPVALSLSYTGNDVVLANSESKSILRAAAAEIERKYSNAHYWPSYEIALAHDVFHEDGRHVSVEGVNLIIDNFLKAYMTRA